VSAGALAAVSAGALVAVSAGALVAVSIGALVPVSSAGFLSPELLQATIEAAMNAIAKNFFIVRFFGVFMKYFSLNTWNKER